MYERNAIVLERYFDKLFKFNELNNLKINYSNYCKLIENIEEFKVATEAENKATNDFNLATADIKKIQNSCEKLYNKSAKLEYSRCMIFENIEEKSEEIQKCLEKIENDVEKNTVALENLDKEFMISSNNYKEKKAILLNAQEENRVAKKTFEDMLNKTAGVFNGIFAEDVNLAKEFIDSDNKDRKRELNNILIENGINERNPFDSDVISNSVNVSFEIYKKEINIYLNVYEKTKKVLNEIKENNIKIDKHRKVVNDGTAKIDFLNAEKDYVVGFLDNERITAIYEKKVHRKLMLSACKSLNSDLEHINTLYDIILKEASSRSSKRLYKDNYNKSYLKDIEKTSENVNEETSKLKANSVAVMNLNYWRIEGIARIQEIFEKNVTEIYGRNLEEIFPEEKKVEEKVVEVEDREKVDEIEATTSIDENQEDCKEDLKEELQTEEISKTTKKRKYSKLKSSKKVFQEALIKFENSSEKFNKNEEEQTKEIDEEVSEKTDNLKTWSFNVTEDEITEKNSDSDGEYKNLFEKISMLDELDEDGVSKGRFSEAASNVESGVFAKIEDGEENSIFKKFNDSKAEEEAMLDFYFKNPSEFDKKRRLNDERHLNKDDKPGFFKKIIGINTKSKRQA